MQTKPVYHPPMIPILLTIGCSLLAVFFAVFTILQQEELRLQKKLDSIPQEIVINSFDHHIATSSATLISESSKKKFVPPYSLSEELVNFFLPPLEAKTPFDETLIQEWVRFIAPQFEKKDSPPKIVKENKTIKVDGGKKGQRVDISKTTQMLLSLPINSTNSAQIAVQETGRELSPDAIIASEKRAQQYLGKTLTLEAARVKRVLKDTDLFVLLNLPDGFESSALQDLANIVDKAIATPPTEPKLTIQDGKVKEFVAPKDGLGLDRETFASSIEEKLRELETTKSVTPLPLKVVKTPPTQSLASTNSLGIADRIGMGESEYQHSIPNRIHNVSLTTSRIHAQLIKPGETFSFNKYLGDVSAATGFKQAYVIKQGQTVLGDGGGVCQVSTTLFRALLNAGLPITERRGHAYRVGYYEQNSKPGFDATVYSPHPDLRFINDTGSFILINAVADPKTLTMYVELWGKSDGRKAEVVNYKQWDAVPAPPPVYQDDPTLKPGTTKQIDFAAPGLKTSFDYVVTYPNGEKKEQTFKTTYTPWAAVYAKGI